MGMSLILRLSSISKINVLSKCNLTSIIPRVQVRMFSVKPKSAQFLKPTLNRPIFSRTFFKFFRKPSAEKLKEADGIPEQYTLIYRNAMHRYILFAQFVSSISAIFVCILAVTYNSWEYDLDPKKWRVDEPSTPMENEGMIYVAAFVTLCVILQLMVSRMPIRIYSYPQKEKYVFVFYGNLPLSKKRMACKVNEVIKLEESGLLPWKDSRYEIVNKRKIILMENFFRRPADLNIMLGYQKPPDNYD